MNANNVVNFPSPLEFKDLSTPEGLGKHFDENKKLYLNSICDFYATQIINKMGTHGFGIYDDQFLNDFTMTVECLRATIYRSLEIDHPLHPEMDRMVELIMATEEDYFNDDDELFD